MKFLYRLMEKENILARIFSIIIACSLWIYVMTDQNPIVERNVEVNLIKANLPDNMVVFNAPERVTVKVRAARALIDDDINKMVTAQIDLTDAGEGQQELPVTARFSKGDVVSITPSEVSVYVDTLSEKTVPVKIRVTGTSVDDLIVGSSVINPAEVTIKGATHRLNNVNRVAAPIDITNQKGDFKAISELVAVSDDGYDIPSIRIAPEKAQIEAKMVKQMLTVELPVRVEMAGVLPDGIAVNKTEVSPEKVRITAPPSLLKSLKEIKTMPVDVSNITGSISVPAELDIPDKAIPYSNTVEVRFSVER